MKCNGCGKETDILRTVVRGDKLFEDLCERCSANPSFADGARRFERDWQRREYAKDLIQHWEKEAYIKNYPDKAREIYSDEDFRKYG